MVWSYPRGGKVSKGAGETALDIVAYAAHMAALLGANIIKVKPPTDKLDLDAAKKVYECRGHRPLDAWPRASATSCSARSPASGSWCSRAARPRTPRACSNEIRQIRDGGGSGSIIGRNSFRRPKAEALDLLDEVIKIYLNEA